MKNNKILVVLVLLIVVLVGVIIVLLPKNHAKPDNLQVPPAEELPSAPEENTPADIPIDDEYIDITSVSPGTYNGEMDFMNMSSVLSEFQYLPNVLISIDGSLVDSKILPLALNARLYLPVEYFDGLISVRYIAENDTFELSSRAVSSLDLSTVPLDEVRYFRGKVVFNEQESVGVLPICFDGHLYFPSSLFSELFDIRYIESTQTFEFYPFDPNAFTEDGTEIITFTLSAGQYVVGEDIAAGKYNCLAISGSGNFTGDVAALGYFGLNEILGAPDAYGDYTSTYSNLRLTEGDVIRIRGDLVIQFTST